MPRYSTFNATFNPISLADRIKPMETYVDTYNQNQEVLGKIGEDMGAVEPIVSSLSDDNPLKQVYNDYQNNISSTTDRLLSGDLGAVGQIKKLRSQLNSVVQPLAQAGKKLETWQEEQRNLKAKDNSMLFDIDATSPTALDYITKNPFASYNMASGDAVTKRVEDFMKNFTKEYRYQLQNGKEPEWITTAERQLLQKDVSKGFSADDIQNIMQHPEKYPSISKGLKSAVESSGVNGWDNPEAVTAMNNAALRGLFAGIGETDFKTANGPGMNDYQSANLRLEREKWAANPANPNSPNYVNPNSNSNKGNGSRNPSQRPTYFGVMMYDVNNGTVRNYTNPAEYNKVERGADAREVGTPVTNLWQLKEVRMQLEDNAKNGNSSDVSRLQNFNNSLRAIAQLYGYDDIDKLFYNTNPTQPGSTPTPSTKTGRDAIEGAPSDDNPNGTDEEVSMDYSKDSNLLVRDIYKAYKKDVRKGRTSEALDKKKMLDDIISERNEFSQYIPNRDILDDVDISITAGGNIIVWDKKKQIEDGSTITGTTATDVSSPSDAVDVTNVLGIVEGDENNED